LFAFAAASSHGDRNEIIRQNIEVLKGSNLSDIKLDCIVFSYIKYRDLPEWLKKIDQDENDICRLVPIYQGTYPLFVRYLDPEFLRLAGYEYVMLQVDDVRLYGPDTHFDLNLYLQFVQRHKLAVASPAIINTPFDNIKPNMGEKDHEGRTVNVLEIQSTIFRLDAWKCYWELNDLEYPSGWTDDFMPSYCFEQERVKENKLQGIMNNQVMVHEKFKSSRPGDHGGTRLKQMESWKNERNITLTFYDRVITGYLD
jgi:hypothetical protein